MDATSLTTLLGVFLAFIAAAFFLMRWVMDTYKSQVDRAFEENEKMVEQAFKENVENKENLEKELRKHIRILEEYIQEVDGKVEVIEEALRKCTKEHNEDKIMWEKEKSIMLVRITSMEAQIQANDVIIKAMTRKIKSLDPNWSEGDTL